MTERPMQHEMRLRRSDYLPFNDKGAIRSAVKVVIEAFPKITKAQGEILFPFDLSPREQAVIRERLAKHHYTLRSRLIFVSGIPMEEGCGTLIRVEGNKPER